MSLTRGWGTRFGLIRSDQIESLTQLSQHSALQRGRCEVIVLFVYCSSFGSVRFCSVRRLSRVCCISFEKFRTEQNGTQWHQPNYGPFIKKCSHRLDIIALLRTHSVCCSSYLINAFQLGFCLSTHSILFIYSVLLSVYDTILIKHHYRRSEIK